MSVQSDCCTATYRIIFFETWKTRHELDIFWVKRWCDTRVHRASHAQLQNTPVHFSEDCTPAPYTRIGRPSACTNKRHEHTSVFKPPRIEFETRVAATGIHSVLQTDDGAMSHTRCGEPTTHSSPQPPKHVFAGSLPTRRRRPNLENAPGAGDDAGEMTY